MQNYSAPPQVNIPPQQQRPVVSPYKPATPVYSPHQSQSAPQPHFLHQQQQFNNSPSPNSFYRQPPQQQHHQQQPHFVAPAPYVPKPANASPFRPASAASSAGSPKYQTLPRSVPAQQHRPLQHQNVSPFQSNGNAYNNGGGLQTYHAQNCSPVPAPTRTAIHLNDLENYNRAARGWGQTKDYYRPITFGKPKATVPYTDF